MSKPTKTDISKVMSELGKRTSPRKKEAAQANQKLGTEARLKRWKAGGCYSHKWEVSPGGAARRCTASGCNSKQAKVNGKWKTVTE